MGLPPLSAAVLERHGRGALGLPPVAPLMPHVRPAKGPSSETDGSEATSQLRQPSSPRLLYTFCLMHAGSFVL